MKQVKIIIVGILMMYMHAISSQTLGATIGQHEPDISILFQMHVTDSNVRPLFRYSFDTAKNVKIESYAFGIGYEFSLITITPYYQITTIELPVLDFRDQVFDWGIYVGHRLQHYKRWHIIGTYDATKGFTAGVMFELDKRI